METVRAHRPPRAVFSEPEAVADTNTRSWYNHETLGELALSRNTSVSLGDHFSDFIDAQVREITQMKRMIARLEANPTPPNAPDLPSYRDRQVPPPPPETDQSTGINTLQPVR